MWSVEMTRRLEQRLQAHGREPEVYYYEGEDPLPGSAGEIDAAKEHPPWQRQFRNVTDRSWRMLAM
ncbi:hypothetical protein QPM17_23555 [Marinobacter sp. TBZ242]|uniref:Uncharacterized protein n=1 Tax=Marinobacter azerbaijanicus TaxID=3050455 RepID=A0ABT7IIW0_9GAMM|nr:hypothetical protein [Marinobacter sp. TBZ242]MDL0434111.1 hypothetical protein [Marinobacter sp. TBZ242]